MNITDKPLAAQGFKSYRYPSQYGWMMIGAKDHADALNEANRGLSKPPARLALLQVWDGQQYKSIDHVKG